MRSWLQSDKDAGEVEWLCQNPPNNANVHATNGVAYDSEAGFMSDFTFNEKKAVKTVSHKQIINPVDMPAVSYFGSDTYSAVKTNWDDLITASKYDTALSYNVIDTMFLLDIKEYKSVYDKSSILGSTYSIGYDASNNNKNVFSWTRTPVASSGGSDVLVINNGIVAQATWNNTALKGNSGVRPAFYLNEEIFDVAFGDGTFSAPFTLTDTSSYEISDMIYNNNEINVEINIGSEEALIVIALYDENDALINVTTNSVESRKTSYSLQLENAEKATKAKAMIVRDMNKLKPLCQAKQIQIG